MNLLTKTDSYVVEVTSGQYHFYEANRVRIRRGRLVFLAGLCRIVGAVEAGAWVRVMAGVTPGDLRNNE